MPKVEGVQEVKKALQERAERIGGEKNCRVSVIVGYTQFYALWVHETPNLNHPVGGWKYLTNTLHDTSAALGRIARHALTKGATIEQALLKAGMLLQRVSQQRVPVDTSALKGSAFTADERHLNQVAGEARTRSDAIRAGALEERARARTRKKTKAKK